MGGFFLSTIIAAMGNQLINSSKGHMNNKNDQFNVMHVAL
jgi:hypothetical protein